MQDNERGLDCFSKQISVACGLGDLREAWTDSRQLTESWTGFVGSKSHEMFGNVVNDMLVRIGGRLDLNDGRVKKLTMSISDAKANAFGTYFYGLNSQISTSFYRFVAGCDPEVKNGLELRPMEPLAGVSIPNVRRLRGNFTDLNKNSPFWGFRVETEKHSDMVGGCSSTRIFVPVGVVELGDLGNDFGEREVCVQDISTRHLYPSTELDTSSGIVERFVDFVARKQH